MNLTLATNLYTEYRVEGDRMTFVGPTHTDSNKDVLLITSTAPKRAGDELGNRRSKANLLQVQSVTNAVGVVKEKDLKVAVDISIPVGTPLATVVDQCNRLASLLADAAVVEDILFNGKQTLV